MSSDPPDFAVARMAHDDFDMARRKAFLTTIATQLRRQPNELLAFSEVERLLPIQSQVYRGMRTVPLAAVRGSVGRYQDFDRNFLPTQTSTRPRWESIDAAMITEVPLPPVQLYQIGAVYFVKDGNHRVSVARERGVEFMDAEVIECTVPVALPADVEVSELLQLAEYGRFLSQTNLDKLRPGAVIEFTALGSYDLLLEHISAHRWYLGINLTREIGWAEAVQSWYDTIYQPMIATIGQHDILRDFPHHTDADLYLWIMDHRWYLFQETGADVGSEQAALSYGAQHLPWGRRVVRWLVRLRTIAVQPFTLSGQLIARARASRRVASGE